MLSKRIKRLRNIKVAKEFIYMVIFSIILTMGFMLLNKLKDQHIELRIERLQLQEELNQYEIDINTPTQNIFVSAPTFEWE